MLNSHPTDGQVYPRVLYPLRDGIPLWFPEDNASPNFPEEHQSTGVRVGDVGILSPEGRFDFIFNICHPEDDPVQWKVPDDFVQMEDSPPMEEIPKYFGKRVISRIDDSKRGVDAGLMGGEPGIHHQGGAEYTVDFSKGIGAALALPDGGGFKGAKEVNAFENHAKVHAHSWYYFVNAVLGWKVQNGSLYVYLVTGVIKSQAWETAVVHNPSRDYPISLSFDTGGSGGDWLSLSQ
ncbi:hypothetical protein Moror_10505 [Moniliophthora roreri MCA 2997]|uniref:Uncharacterized protein n=1 Tax=Moniliophthora roreri (strain MCA 2997) TaxID=1381753 RepID=V2WYA9_MONRO|nr:hypothetical protein Moror_10505 [Moniliophthora roreri MCA 2997]